MKKKIAVAVDGSVHCGCAVRYAAAMSRTISDLHYVLLHVQPALSQYLTDEAERHPKAARALKAIVKVNAEASRELLEKTKRLMVQNGIDEERIETRTRIRINSVAEEILDECRVKSLDAVVLGRRGATYLQELVTGSVTANVLAHSQLTPVWVVDGDVSDNRILLAVDGSQNALRALDHLAYMRSGHTDTRIHMVHVKPRLADYCAIEIADESAAAAEEILLQDDRRCIDDFYAKAAAVLEKNGLDAGQLDLQIVESRFSLAGAILQAARNAGCATIVVGRRGDKKGLFTGSVSRKIIQKASDMAVWLVP